MVTGGWYNGNGGLNTPDLDSTEVFSDNVWRTLSTKLPFPMGIMKVATVNNRVLFFGKSFF